MRGPTHPPHKHTHTPTDHTPTWIRGASHRNTPNTQAHIHIPTQDILQKLGEQGSLYALTGGYLRNFHSMLWEKRAPVCAVPTAVDVLTTGSYQRFPLMSTVCFVELGVFESFLHGLAVLIAVLKSIVSRRFFGSPAPPDFRCMVLFSSVDVPARFTASSPAQAKSTPSVEIGIRP